MNETVLVTGGSGFIGSWVLRELSARGLDWVVYDIAPSPGRWQRVLRGAASNVRFEQGSLLDRTRLAAVCEQYRVTHFIHLGALLTLACQDDPWSGCEVNVLGSVSLFEQARRQGARTRGLAYASSLSVFGPEPDDGLASLGAVENRPPNFYGVFKQTVERIAEQYWRHFQLASLGIRPHVVYGPERDQGLSAGPSLAARAAALGEPFTINFTGRAGYDYVEDVALAFVRAALETPTGADVVDLPSSQATVEDVIAKLNAIVPGSGKTLAIAGPAIPASDSPQPHLITELFPDWQSTSLELGLRKTVEYYSAR